MNSTAVSSTLYPVPRRPASLAPRIWAGAVLLLASLVLVGFGGCFLIGVLALLRPELFLGPFNGSVTAKPVSLSTEERALLLTLYAFAIASLLGAVTLFLLGLRALSVVLRPEVQAGDS